MTLKIIFIILVMFAAFIAVCGIGAMLALIFAEENRKVCHNCHWFDGQMTCCRRTWRKVTPSETTCMNFQRARGGVE